MAYMRLQDYEASHKYEDSKGLEQVAALSKNISPARRKAMLVLYTATGTFVAFAILYAILISQNIDQCGTTAAEARSKGCVFETMSFAWLPIECYDDEVDREFQAQDLLFHRDANYTEPVAWEEVSRGDGHGFFVTHDYHTAHCAFLLKKLHRAYHRRGKIDGLITSLHHTTHCVHMILDPPEDVWTVPQFAFTKWPYCGKSGGYNVQWSKQGQWTD